MAKNKHMGYGYMTLGEDTKGHDFKAFGDTTGKYIFWDASADSFYIAGTLYLNGTAITATATELNRMADASGRIISAAAATLALTEATHDGAIVVLNKADDQALTLPAATGSGARFRLIVGTTITGTTTIKVTGDDVMYGYAVLALDGGDTCAMFATAADSDTITLNGDTTGGLAGAEVELIDIAADKWFVRVFSDASGSEATPFSATVT